MNSSSSALSVPSATAVKAAVYTVAPSSPATRQAVMFAGGALIGVSAALAVHGMFHLDDIARAAFEKSPALPHLALIAMNTPQAGFDPGVARLLVRGALIGHAVCIGLAGVLGSIAGARAKNAAGTPWLALALGTFSFYLAQFSFVHPAARLETASPALLLIDFLAAAALGVAFWAMLRFVTRFPAVFDAQGYERFQVARLAQGVTEGAASRFAWRRWLSRHQAESYAKNQKLDRWRACLPLRLQATLAAPFFGGFMAMAFTLTLRGAPQRGDNAAAIGAFGALFIALIIVMMSTALCGAVLAWHAAEGAPTVRHTARLLVRTPSAALTVIPIGMFGGMTLGTVTESWRIISGSMLAVPAGLFLAVIAAFVTLAVCLWRKADA